MAPRETVSRGAERAGIDVKAEASLDLVTAKTRAAFALAAALAWLCVAPASRAQSAEDKTAPCLACHGGAEGSDLPETPSLGGQPMLFAAMQLFLFREGRRPGTVMPEIAKGMSDADLRFFAEFVSKLPPPNPDPGPPDPERMKRGAKLAQEHICQSCHNPDYSGRDQIPRLAGQREDYLLKSLREYKSGERVGVPASMPEVLAHIDDAGLEDLAHYLAHFKP